MRRQALYGEATRDADFTRVLFGLVVEEFRLCVPYDRRVDLCAAHPGLDVRIGCYRLERDMRYALIDKPFTYFTGLHKPVIRKPSSHNSLPSQCKCNP